jgi:hypothetical protein
VHYGAGFFPPDAGSGARWMGGEGILTLKNTHRDMVLHLRGWAVDGLDSPPTISILINGDALESITGTMDFDKEIEVAAAKQGPGASSELVIRTDKSYVPAEAGKGSDQRRLGLLIINVSWEPLSSP